MKRTVISVVACMTSIYSYAGIWGNVIGGATGGAIGRSVGKTIAKPDMERVIAVSVDAVNKQTPMMVDDSIRLERAIAGPDLLFTYQYTTIKLRRSDADTGLLFGGFAKDLRNRTCANDKLHIFLKNHVTMAYAYSSSDGFLLGTINVTPKDCGFEK